MTTNEALADHIRTDYHTLTEDENGKAIFIADAYDGIYTFKEKTVVVRNQRIESITTNNNF